MENHGKRSSRRHRRDSETGNKAACSASPGLPRDTPISLVRPPLQEIAAFFGGGSVMQAAVFGLLQVCIALASFRQRGETGHKMSCGSGIRKWSSLACSGRLPEHSGQTPNSIAPKLDVLGSSCRQRNVWQTKSHVTCRGVLLCCCCCCDITRLTFLGGWRRPLHGQCGAHDMGHVMGTTQVMSWALHKPCRGHHTTHVTGSKKCQDLLSIHLYCTTSSPHGAFGGGGENNKVLTRVVVGNEKRKVKW